MGEAFLSTSRNTWCSHREQQTWHLTYQRCSLSTAVQGTVTILFSASALSPPLSSGYTPHHLPCTLRGCLGKCLALCLPPRRRSIHGSFIEPCGQSTGDSDQASGCTKSGLFPLQRMEPNPICLGKTEKLLSSLHKNFRHEQN